MFEPRTSPRERDRSSRRPPSGRDRALVGSGYPRAVGKAFLAAARLRVWRWDQALARLPETQERQLRRALHQARDSEIGRRYRFDEIPDYDTFRRRVPIGDYDSFAPDFARMRRGEPNVLTGNRVRYICQSAGSSQEGRPKFLPVADPQIRFQRGSAVDAVYRYLAWRRDDTLTDGFVMSVLPPTVLRREGNIEVTNNPALMMTKLPRASEPLYLPDRATRAIDDLDRKLEVIAQKYLDHDVRSVTGTTCWFSILFDKLLRAARRAGRDVEHVRELWPNLDFLVGGGVAADPYLPVISERVGNDDLVLVDTYNATEGGVFAVSDHASEEPGLLVIPDRGVFYELVPLEERDRDTPTRLAMWEAETERDYLLHVTTVSGLTSYRLGDIVRFRRLWPHRLEFTGRLAGCLSTTQELTTHLEVQRAVDAALEAAPGRIVDYAVGADIGVDGTAKARYVIFAEFVAGQEPLDQRRFAEAFDEAHIAQNRAYREHRQHDTAILPPTLVALPRGSVERFLRESGMSNLQSKFPRIVDERRRDLLRSYAT